MHLERLACLVFLGACAAACGSSEDPSTSSTTSSSSSTASGAGGASTTTGDTTSSSSTSGGGGGGGGPAACTPAPGSKAIDAICDSVRLAVLEHTGGKTRAAIRGRLFTAP